MRIGIPSSLSLVEDLDLDLDQVNEKLINEYESIKQHASQNEDVDRRTDHR